MLVKAFVKDRTHTIHIHSQNVFKHPKDWLKQLKHVESLTPFMLHGKNHGFHHMFPLKSIQIQATPEVISPTIAASDSA